MNEREYRDRIDRMMGLLGVSMDHNALGSVPKQLATRPGLRVPLKSQDDDSTVDVGHNSPLVQDWTVIVQPTPGTMEKLRGGLSWSARMKILYNYDGAAFSFYRSAFNNTPLEIPVVGVAVGVHGQYVRLGCFQVSDVAQELDVYAAIIPRGPIKSNSVALLRSNGVNPTDFEIPAMTRHFWLFTEINAGDTVEFLTPNGANVGTLALIDNILGVPLPLPPGAAIIRYNTAAAVFKDIIIDFEVWT